MAIRRRDFLKSTAAVATSLSLPRLARGAETASIYDLERFGNARILHLTDTHAQLNPVYFREPSVNIGIGEMAGRPPHLVGRAFLDRFGIRPDSADAYAFSCFEFEKSAGRFGKLGGFAHLKTLIDRLRGAAGEEHSVLVDGGDLFSLASESVRVQPGNDPYVRGVVADSDVLVAELDRCERHFEHGILAVRPGGVAMEISANIREFDQLRRLAAKWLLA